MWAPGYPLYQLGGPQLRVFRTNFFIQLVRPGVAQPEDTVQFRIPMEMTRVDLRNYLESIYNVPVAAVRTRVQYGSNKRRDHRNVRIKKPDYKVAYVQLPSQTPSKEQNGQGSTPCFRRTAARGGRPGGPGTPDSPGALGVATAPGGLDPEDWPAGSLRMEVFYSRCHSLAQAGVQWCDHGLLQPQHPGLTRSSRLSLPQNWGCRCLPLRLTGFW
ncbi:39S ribosomal protein L23, mitochondrial isoform X3 [Papio anubis]|uniref:39S ribosomal protein L23, mitochondrial isoform X3 n=1 Tax=Papio anubis TaxID=9555 RepID=UPI000B7B5227|nr:39S ribosomal protein L23, mitochondrial isoform X3 [Papio anubis]